MALEAVRTAGQLRRRRKLGEIVAERIVAEIIDNGWSEGEVLGTERDFMDRYRVSRATFREAMRQVEWHGIAGMRRGANGGLVVKAPPRDAIVFAFKTYLELTKVPRDDCAFVTGLLQKAAKRAAGEENLAISLFLEALDERTLEDLAEQRRASGAGAKLSESIAFRIVRDIETSGAAKGTNLGNEGELQQRYGVSRAVLREALRHLELHEIVRVKTGVQGGIIVHQVDPTYTIELASTFLAYARIPFVHNWEIHAPLELAAVEGFAARAREADFVRLENSFIRLNAASAPRYLVAAADFHQAIADGCGNRALALIVRLFLTHTPKILPVPDERFLPMLKQGHRELIAAMRERNAARGVELMRGMFEHSRRWLVRNEPRRGERVG